MKTALDNDLLIKGACFWLLPEIIEATQSTTETCGILGAAKYVCTKALSIRGLQENSVFLSQLIEELVQLEPTDAETSIAAEIEFEAQRYGLQLDAGESLLFAIVDVRSIPRLGTGDKRAITAIERIIHQRETNSSWVERVLCLEQIVRRIVKTSDPVAIRNQICAAHFADRSLAICFSCASGKGDAAAWLSGLESYIADIRKNAPTILAPD